MNRDHFWLSDRQFAKLKPHLPTDTRGKPRVDDRRVISGIIHVIKSGGRWVDAPAAYGPRKTLYNRFQRWADKGIWSGIFNALANAGGPPAQLLIDSSAVRAHRSAAGGKRGNSTRPSAGSAALSPISRRRQTGRGRTASRRTSTGTATPSSACSAGSRTSAALQPDTIDWLQTSSQRSASQQPSATGYESGP